MKSSIGRYIIMRVLGSGGYATVHLARDPKTNRKVAIKLLHRHLAGNPIAEEFQREIRTLRQFEHPHVVQFLADGVENGVQYYVMEYLPNGDLDQKISDATNHRLAPKAAAEILLPILDALDYVHGSGYVHCDLKAAAVLFDPEDRPILADFSTVKTTAQACIAVDLHSFGTILRRCLTGDTPAAPTHDLPLAPDKATTTVSIELGQLVMKLLNKDLQECPNAASLKKRLEEALDT